MADKRKLAIEMEKCFKKIDEGVEIFEDKMSKLDEVTNENQREKIQNELKKEIKKLQRLREQVKNWQGSSDIKEKEKLNQYRRLIEQRMETFKGIEREFKTKPHSNQGLSTEEKIDPKEKEKADTLEWLKNQIRAIEDDIDRTESKIELFSTTDTGKKRGKAKTGSNSEKDQWDKHLERIKFHLENLEVCMRMVMNDKLSTAAVNSKLKEPLDMYIDALESECYDELENLEPDDVYEELGLGDYISQLAAAVVHVPVPQPPVQPVPTKPTESKTSESKPHEANSAKPHSQLPVHVTQSMPFQSFLYDQELGTLPGVIKQPIHKPKVHAKVSRPSSTYPPSDDFVIVSSDVMIRDNKSTSQPSNYNFMQPTSRTSNSVQSYVPPASQSSAHHSPISQSWEYNPTVRQPSKFDVLLASDEVVGLSHLPVQVPDFTLPDWFPKRDHLDVDPAHFEKLELGTLFFTFYYMEGTVFQLLASSQLKRSGWRFNTRYLMWFRRKTDPIECAADFERGDYHYFDYEQWGLRVAENFVFYYAYLEEYPM